MTVISKKSLIKTHGLNKQYRPKLMMLKQKDYYLFYTRKKIGLNLTREISPTKKINFDKLLINIYLI